MVTDARLLVAVVCLMTVLGGPGVMTAAAGNGNQPQTDPIAGTFSFATVRLKQRSCAGQDGPYAEFKVESAGTASGDPRLTGDLELGSDILLNLATGLGTSEGRFTLRDSATGKKKADGEFHGVITPASPTQFLLHGMLLGKVHDEGTGTIEDLIGSGRILANFQATFDQNLNGSGEFGGSGDSQTPAVIQSGHCTDAFTTTP